MAKENNKDRILKLLKECKNHQTAESIAVQLNIQRNTASGILNELVREGIVQKEKTRPVIFSYIQPEDQLSEDPFTTFIGADQSLKDAVEKCKLSAGYPNKGMPILLFGSSGVGKSLLAEYIYQYAKFIGTIPEDAPFVVLNCADYANNKELLSSVLFGYKKGAFTGANKDTKGLIEEADKGYLFLDEVHRLSPEGQEKLFRYMDKGIISRMGDSGQNCELNVRLIFATTEGRETMLDTFLRRIPVDVVLPDFQERTLEEKYELILFLIHQESKTMNAALIFMDVDGLKHTNDLYGHNAGDELIISAAQCIKNVFAAYGKCYRIGGDEFCVLIFDSIENMDELLKQMDHEIIKYNRNNRYYLSIARGVSFLKDTEGKQKKISDWKYEADQDMYCNKKRRNINDRL